MRSDGGSRSKSGREGGGRAAGTRGGGNANRGLEQRITFFGPSVSVLKHVESAPTELALSSNHAISCLSMASNAIWRSLL